MAQVAQVIMTGLLSPVYACQDLATQPINMALSPSERGWHFWNFSFQIVRDHFYAVVNYSHDDNLDRGIAVGKIRASMRNLVNWLLLGQSIMTSANMQIASDEVMVRYEGDNAWVAHVPLENELTGSLPVGSNEGISVGVSWLPYLLNDPRLLYVLQDYSTSLNHPDFCLFFLWRAVEWVLWEFEKRENIPNPAFAPAATALGLTVQWFEEIGRLAHTYTRHARLRDSPEARLVDAARERVRFLILRYIDVKHKQRQLTETELPTDQLTNWTPLVSH